MRPILRPKNRPLMNPEEIDTTRFSKSRFFVAEALRMPAGRCRMDLVSFWFPLPFSCLSVEIRASGALAWCFFYVSSFSYLIPRCIASAQVNLLLPSPTLWKKKEWKERSLSRRPILRLTFSPRDTPCLIDSKYKPYPPSLLTSPATPCSIQLQLHRSMRAVSQTPRHTPSCTLSKSSCPNLIAREICQNYFKSIAEYNIYTTAPQLV